ncbi:AMN1 [Candida jiufengensis]|uniref:AMN1 n=1 Tax=Candida jiufengensis TaxID=497108 RepID=UPI0022246E67|nr:AMN1 [Candida jiufengensis]KAI5951810.1 AMN1 [Candida jiufengensis]
MNFNSTKPLPFKSCSNYTYNPFNQNLNNQNDNNDDDETPFRKARRTNSLNSLSDFKKSKFNKNDLNSNKSSPYSSDLESLPDLTDDENPTPESSPIKSISNHNLIFLDNPTTTNVNLKLQQLTQPPSHNKLSIFDIPEIVHKIVSFVDIQNTQLPNETSVIRRKPTSYKHALLIYGDKAKAQAAISDSNNFVAYNNDHQPTYQNIQTHFNNPLLNCLLINKLFNRITRDIISSKLYFSDEIQLMKYLESSTTTNKVKFQNPTYLNLHKLFHMKNAQFLKLISNIRFNNLSSLELFMCPKLQPPLSLLQQSSNLLKKIIITGSKAIDDEFCYQISLNCHDLNHLDFRGCELITDSGLYFIFKTNKNLVHVNVGRKNKNHLITDQSIHYLITNNPNLDTLGLAGTYISDKSLWEISQNLPNLKRLSLNNCLNLTNFGISSIFADVKILPNLQVLELCLNYQILDLTQLIKFKNYKNFNNFNQSSECFLMELCEELMVRYRDQELQMDKVISNNILQDISFFINS